LTEQAPARARACTDGARVAAVAAGLAALVAACSPLPPYESTAAALAGRHAPSARFATEWKPVSRDLSAPLSADESVRGDFWLRSCVSELTARFTPAPEGAVRALQIAECMEARGWHLVVRESAGLSRAAAADASRR